jgi:hypothetical protein
MAKAAFIFVSSTLVSAAPAPPRRGGRAGPTLGQAARRLARRI